ncbi:McrB family protein [Levilactobacillus enshiensis]|uniref:McrB family protein n=1 Tax=Levilactobacillus enshiensis TaxID=2590213 RepID=UPI00117A96DA|nr:AAA family ATPase [Levilactobacillus enshiensis]
MTLLNGLFIGVLDNTDFDGQPSKTGGVIPIQKGITGEWLVHIKVLNSNNKKYVDKEVNMFLSENQSYGFSLPTNLDNLEKQRFAESLSRWVFIFNIERDMWKDGKEKLTAQNIERIVHNTDFSESDMYELIPVIHEFPSVKDSDDLNDVLISGKVLEGPSDKVLGKDLDTISSFLIFESQLQRERVVDRFYEFLNPSEINTHYIKYEIPTGNNPIVVFNWNNEVWNGGIYRSERNPDVLFVPVRYLAEGKLSEKLTKASVDSLSQSIERKEKIEDMDKQIIDRFSKMVKSKKYNLTFDKIDLLNFHTSIKTNNLTILAGLSGTGKSKIITAYADALGLIDKEGVNSQFNMISVRPFWQDDSDLLGYVDTLSSNYHPGDSGLVDTLINASKNPDKMYIIVLDEMNLARVEHYFSQFLSVMEMDSGDRFIRLYNENLAPRLYNSQTYEPRIQITPNVRFVGTMNIDETTYQMSDKLLDRANVIELKMMPFNQRISEANSINPEDFSEISYSNYSEVIGNKDSLSEKELDFFWELHVTINKVLPMVGLGWRNLNSIEQFLSNIPIDSGFDRKIALDYQVAQRVFPKVRGAEDALNELLFPDKEDMNKKSLFELLDQYKDLSNFDVSKGVLNQKKAELKVNGFVS